MNWYSPLLLVFRSCSLALVASVLKSGLRLMASVYLLSDPLRYMIIKLNSYRYLA